MSVRQYIGARYVPIFYSGSNGSAWDSGVQYDPLVIVSYLNNYYTSKKTVPSTVGAPNLNPDYWANIGLLSNIESRVNTLESEMDAAQTDIENLEEVTDRLDNRKFIFISDSYGNFPSTENNWITSLVSQYGLTSSDYYKNAVNGAGFFVEGSNSFLTALQNVSVAHPEEITDVVVAGGANDAGNVYQNYTTLRTNIDAFVSYAKTTYPNATVWIGYLANVVIGGRLSDGYSYFSQQAVMNYYKDTPGAVYLTGVEQVMHRQSWYDEGVHPDATAAAAIARAVMQCLIGAGCEYNWYPTDIVVTPIADVTVTGTGGIVGRADLYGSIVRVKIPLLEFSCQNGLSLTSNTWTKVGTYTCLSLFANDEVYTNAIAQVMVSGTAGVHNQPFNVMFKQGELFLKPLYIDGGSYPTQAFTGISTRAFCNF